MIRWLAFVLLAACYPAAPAGGIQYSDETRAWQPELDRLLQLQATAIADQDWPRFYATRTHVAVELHDAPFDCSGVLACGCTVALGGYDNGGDPWLHPGAPTWYFAVQLTRAADVYHTAIGYELGHVYLSAHGMVDDDGYRGEFWREWQSALDAWAPTGPASSAL